MRYGSVCSGIEAATVAWHPIGWKPQWFSEIDPFPCKVLKFHYPDIKNLGDMTLLLENETFANTAIDLLVGGTPCQSFSLAGLRGGMGDERGNLALVFCRLLIKKQPKWFLWENVPGVFSSFTDEAQSEDGGDITQSSDFATLLQAFQECGYSVCWRVLDSQYFGVPQRRRRVFAVGHLGTDWRPPFAVLFERQSLCGDITPRREKRQDAAGDAKNSTGVEGFRMSAFGQYEQDQSASAMKMRDYKDATDLVCSIDTRTNPVIYQLDQITSPQNGNNPKPGDPAPPLTTDGRNVVVGQDEVVRNTTKTVRRLTPTECERLQGFPDGYVSKVPSATETACYKALGNSMTTNVMKWIGERIDLVDKIIAGGKNA